MTGWVVIVCGFPLFVSSRDAARQHVSGLVSLREGVGPVPRGFARSSYTCFAVHTYILRSVFQNDFDSSQHPCVLVKARNISGGQER